MAARQVLCGSCPRPDYDCPSSGTYALGYICPTRPDRTRPATSKPTMLPCHRQPLFRRLLHLDCHRHLQTPSFMPVQGMQLEQRLGLQQLLLHEPGGNGTGPLHQIAAIIWLSPAPGWLNTAADRSRSGCVEDLRTQEYDDTMNTCAQFLRDRLSRPTATNIAPSPRVTPLPPTTLDPGRCNGRPSVPRSATCQRPRVRANQIHRLGASLGRP